MSPLPPTQHQTNNLNTQSALNGGEETNSVGAEVGVKFGKPASPGEIGTLGPYRLIKELGHGGMGAVYAAIDTRLDRQLALKLMLPKLAANPAAKERFLREARAVAKISHDNVVTVYEADERDGVPYIAMQFLQGYPLDEYLKKKGLPSISQALRIAAETATGLAAAHRLGLVHRDIKPGNLWLEAPNGRVKVLDFGLAKPVDTEVELTRSGAVVGTPAYMSPEQARGEKVDHRTDLFSLGAVLYRLCTGRLPFHGPTTMAMLMALGTEEPKPVRELNPEVPESFAGLIHELLAKRAGDRPQSGADIVKRVRAILEELKSPRAEPVEPSTSQQQVLPSHVIYVPIPVTVHTEQNPFADIDVSDTELVAGEGASPTEGAAAEPKPERKKPGGKKIWMVTGLVLALTVLIVGGVIIIIKNKDGTETKIEVPDGATVTVKGKEGNTLARVGPENTPPVVADGDRAAAEWALSLGGEVRVNDDDRAIKAVAELPKDKFTLTSLNLQGTPVTDAGLAHIKELKGLTDLSLVGTPVTDAGLTHLKELKNLTFLNLDGTRVTGTGLTHLKELKRLTGLSLVGTRVTDEGLTHIKELKSLTQLHLGNTQMTDVSLTHLKELKYLAMLDLSRTRVTDAGLMHLEELKRLTWLSLSGTKVTDEGLTHLKELKSLTSLYLQGTAVRDAGLPHLKELQNLTGLDLNGTLVTDVGLAHLKGLTRLKELHLQGTKVADTGLMDLNELKGLVSLSLGNTQVSDVGLAHLKGLKNLAYLDLRRTKVTAKGLAEFHAAVPGCKIEHDGGIIAPMK